MTSPAMQERREVVKAERRDAELAQRFHDRQWHKRHRVQPKPLSLEGPTNADHIALYQREKERYQARRAPIVADEIERVRAAIAKLDPEADERSRKRQERVNARNTARANAFKTHFKCKHERSIENTYMHKSRKRTYAECKECLTKRNAGRDRRKKTDLNGLTAGLTAAYGA